MIFDISSTGTSLVSFFSSPTNKFDEAEIKTDELESKTPYIITIKAHKSGYVLPPEEVIMSLYLLENELILNQSKNDDSIQSVYWQEITSMSVKPYGKISEDFTVEYNIPNYFNSLQYSTVLYNLIFLSCQSFF